MTAGTPDTGSRPARSARPGATAGVSSPRPWREASQRVRRWLRGVPARSTLAVVAGPHPDGLAAATIVRQALRRADMPVLVTCLARGEDPWSDLILRDLIDARPAAVVAAGIGSPSAWPLALPLLAFDRRPLPPAPPGVTTISSAGWTPPASTSALAYWLWQGVADIHRLDWVAALGVLSAQGERGESAVVTTARKAHGATMLNDLLVLLRAASRASNAARDSALSLLARARDPKDALFVERRDLLVLRAAQREVEAAIDATRDIRPLTIDPVVLVRVASPCLVQGVLATVWQARYPERAVLIGNEGYLPGRIAFAETPVAPSSGLPLGAILEPAAADDPVLAGHLAPDDWQRLLESRGLPIGIWGRRHRTLGREVT